MNSFTNTTVARQMIQERVQDAERRAQVRAIRADRRAARQASQSRPVSPPQTRELPWWAFRFMFPAR
jgi:hypothetical protein